MPRKAPRRPGRQRARSRVIKPAVRNGRAELSAVPDTFYRDLVWNLRNGIVAVTRDGSVAVMNEAAYSILGLKPRPDDIGRPFLEILKEVPDVCRIIAGAFDLSHLPNRAELRLKRTAKVIGYTLSHVCDAQGELAGATLFFKDLTRVEQLEERERLRDRLAALGEMAAAIAHEVKNPLAGIEVMAGILKRQMPESEDAQTILGDIIKEAKMANAIVIEVLDFVRPIRLQVEQIALAEVVDDAVSTAESHASRGDVKISLALPGDLPRLQGDTHQLRQLFTNLLVNAFEALGGSGDVQISASAVAEEESGPGIDNAGPMIQVTVSDSGPGIPAEVIDRIFSPFFTTKPQGSGLGLAIVRKIVDAHDGRIDVGARPGGGTMFRVTLPVRTEHELFR
ncbi:MAG TPA: ATP-binding protein [Vicinamibacterales bacterium]|jgi:signal transduction histidine kinase|nr:ATP-binding protein [Vicinamibacterales bacterium]